MIVLIGALISALSGVFAVYAGRHKARADASDILSGAAAKLVVPMQARIDKLEARVAKLESQNEALTQQVREFRDLIRALWAIASDLTTQLLEEGHCPRRSIAEYEAFVKRALGDTTA
jgi:outer membrane murein-binding lipoprotein Lpp